MANLSAGAKFRAAVAEEKAKGKALQVVGAVNAYSAILAQKSGVKALYLSGGGVAACFNRCARFRHHKRGRCIN